MKAAVFWEVALVYLKIEAASTSENLINFYQVTRRNIPEGSYLTGKECFHRFYASNPIHWLRCLRRWPLALVRWLRGLNPA
jgi:hypothetical protein